MILGISLKELIYEHTNTNQCINNFHTVGWITGKEPILYRKLSYHRPHSAHICLNLTNCCVFPKTKYVKLSPTSELGKNLTNKNMTVRLTNKECYAAKF